MGDASAYPPDRSSSLPTSLTPRQTREAFSRYLAEITYMDSQVGELLQTLEASGRAADTLVLFTSEQGSQFPGNKWTNWDTGVHTALIARWPGMIAAGARTDALVQYADVLPTLLEVAGGDPTRSMFDGTSLLEGAHAVRPIRTVSMFTGSTTMFPKDRPTPCERSAMARIATFEICYPKISTSRSI